LPPERAITGEPCGGYYCLREIIVRQLHVQRQVKTHCALTDINAVAVDFRITRKELFQGLGRGFGRRDRRVLRQ
jgi:hypothetical protein